MKQKTGKKGIIGQQLMAQVFNEDNPVLRLNQLETDGDRDEQTGFKFLFMGAMTGIRNPKGHDAIRQNDPFRTLQYLVFADLLAHRIDEANLIGLAESPANT